jgi:DNA-binding beta-propeller fold protein YncE
LSEFDLLDGTFIRTFGAGEGSGDGQLKFPCGCTVLPPTGEIAVTDSNNHSVSIFDGESGKFVRKFGSRGKEKDGEFDCPIAVNADEHGNLIVLDVSTARLQVFSKEGVHLCTRSDLGIKEGYSNKGIAWSAEAGCLVIANGSSNNALVFYPQK